MRHYPADDYDRKEATRLKAEPWMLEVLKLNPGYVSWGNHEDYMINRDGGWTSPLELEGVGQLFELDSLNELVHGYFFVDRNQKECTACGRSGYNPETYKLSQDWYGFRNPRDRWDTRITQDEVDALVRKGRLYDFTGGASCDDAGMWTRFDRNLGRAVPCDPPQVTAEQVNQWAAGRGLGHDSINQHICVETRAKRLGVYGLCTKCEGQGSVFTEEKARLALQLWYIHPRKGASRGVIVKNVNQGEIPVVQTYFKKALDRTIERFSKLAGL